jgi:hypothetical protein
MQLTRQQQEDLFITALEGGSNYWYHIVVNDLMPPNSNKSLSERIFNEVYDNDRTFAVYEDNKNGTFLGVIDKSSLEIASKRETLINNKIFTDIEREGWDAETADVWFQLVVMGEVIYG